MLLRINLTVELQQHNPFNNKQTNTTRNSSIYTDKPLSMVHEVVKQTMNEATKYESDIEGWRLLSVDILDDDYLVKNTQP